MSIIIDNIIKLGSDKCLKNLCELNLEETDINDDYFIKISKIQLFGHLEKLNLKNCKHIKSSLSVIKFINNEYFPSQYFNF